MTDTTNNDRPSETPKPPEGFKGTLLDWAVKHWVAFTPAAYWEQQKAGAIAELAELRDKAAAYDEAMEWLAAVHEGGKIERLDEFVRDEIASGRLKP